MTNRFPGLEPTVVDLDSPVHLAQRYLASAYDSVTSLAALGLHAERDLFKDVKSLNALFRTRNRIAHEMDMTRAAVQGRGKRTRHERAQSAYIEMCHDGLNYCQRVLNRLEAEVR